MAFPLFYHDSDTSIIPFMLVEIFQGSCGISRDEEDTWEVIMDVRLVVRSQSLTSFP